MTALAAELSAAARVAEALRAAPEAAVRPGAAPRRAAARRDGSVLWRVDRPSSADVAPVIVVHGLVGGPEMTDLDADSSVMLGLAEAGAPAYGIDWGPSSGALWRALRFEDFALDRLGGFVADVTRAEGRRPVLAGVCEGGLFALCLAATAPRALAGLALMVTPIDTHAAPDAPLHRLARGLGRERLARLIDAFGGLPGPLMSAAFRRLTPSRSLARGTLELLAADGDPARLAKALRMERWLAERPDHPAAAARQLVLELYCDNALARGLFKLDGAAVRLRDVAVPALRIMGLRDHIVPSQAARAYDRLAAAPARETALDAGHVGVFVSRRARGRVAAALAGFAADQAVLAASRV